MSDSATVSVEIVRRVAELASLELTAEEETRMLRDLNAILGHVSQLNELDTSAVVPMAQVSEVIGDSRIATVLRADEVRPSLDRGRVMACAPETDGTFFKVPKVIER
ncbi:MAG: Asp-tRNA(Asn)/Glu-tRNA(Gln) amidotransferase subunit GatC [Alloacidobacterium sp.]|jgi:aspartyl-tRNA(Asn)/glutamyl-tRNA(Gln) amidotransferase subunit C